MQWTEIAIDRLLPHPQNSNVMPEYLLKKLVAHIKRSDRYPPIIVRPLLRDASDTTAETHQILDGHHRVEALRRLGRSTATCVSWPVDDDEALLLMTTLNRLEGQDDPRKRAKLLTDLSNRSDWEALKTLLPERSDQLQRLLPLARPAPPPRSPQPMSEMPQAVYFFLKPSERRTLEQRLKAIGGEREAALMTLVHDEREIE
ncbi:ParB N-terminal domain-containing protein [Phycisphaerales bacterium AB-hyl4]|uniref:ParB N-terminal domain-containing protein n=1 Tax=Natronomicrosphaera hydrolytica TaxID=3242702 RepID=A0ABV4UA91_9BACT